MTLQIEISLISLSLRKTSSCRMQDCSLGSLGKQHLADFVKVCRLWNGGKVFCINTPQPCKNFKTIFRNWGMYLLNIKKAICDPVLVSKQIFRQKDKPSPLKSWNWLRHQLDAKFLNWIQYLETKSGCRLHWKMILQRDAIILLWFCIFQTTQFSLPPPLFSSSDHPFK